MIYCPSLKAFESERGITDNHAGTTGAKRLPQHSRLAGPLTEDTTCGCLSDLHATKHGCTQRHLPRGTLASLIKTFMYNPRLEPQDSSEAGCTSMSSS